MTTLLDIVGEAMERSHCDICREPLGMAAFHGGIVIGAHHRRCCPSPDRPSCAFLEHLALAVERAESRLPALPERSWVDVGGEGGP